MLLHDRSYSVQTYRVDAERIRIRGRVTDTKPAGLYIDDDPEPLDVHDMVVDIVVSYPMLVIETVDVVMDTHPHSGCTAIEAAYQQLVGLPIARGFSRKVTELFGGPSGCTHVGALLRAMAPVIVQSMYSMQRADPNGPKELPSRSKDPEIRERALAFVRNSCHLWAEDGPMTASIERDEAMEVPVWLKDRYDKLGRSDELSNL